MQKTKKMLSLLLAVVFAFAMMVPTAFAAQFSDVPETYRYYEAVENLAARGIINGMGDGTFAPDANVKRDEFAKIVCIGLLSTGEIAPAAGAGFTDVADNRWSSGFIKVAAAAGIINGMGDGTFAPENPVTYEQAIKMLVCALGYDAQAQQRGGYPNGYLTLAGSLGLLKNVNDGAIGTPANRGLIAKLVDNALTVEIFDPLTGKTTGSVADNDERQSIKGQVVSVYGSTIFAGEESACGKKQIEIQKGNSREIYSIENLNLNVNDYLGRMVVAYYDDVAGADYYELTSLSLQKGRNSTTKIDLGTIEGYTDTSIEYLPSEDADYEEASVESDAIIMYNGVATTDKLSRILDNAGNASGEITLLDTAGDGSASIVFVKVYETIVVNNVDKNNYKVYDKVKGGATELNEKDRSLNISFTKNGKAAEFSDIAVGNILSIATSSDGKTIEVLISSASPVKGTITEITSDRMTIVVNNKTYKVAKSYADEANKLFDNDVYATFYLDVFGKIAFAEIGTSTTSSFKYAYLIGAEKEGATSDVVKVRLYDITGSTPTAKTITLADNVRINGTSYKNADDVLALLEDSASLVNVGKAGENAETYTQIIKYSLKGSYIDKIITYQEDEDGNPVVSRNDVNVLNIDNIDAADLTAASTSKLGKYSLSSAKVLVIPKDDRIGGKYANKSSNSFKTAGVYNAQIIDASETNIPKIVLLYGEAVQEEDMESITPAVITSVSGSKDVSGFDSPPNVLKVMDINGNETEFYSDGSETYSKLPWGGDNLEVPSGSGNFRNLEVGDVVKVRADSISKIEEIMLVAKANSIMTNNHQEAGTLEQGNNGTQRNAQYRYFLGTARAVDKANGNTMVATPKFATDAGFDDETADETHEKISNSVLVYVVDTQASNDRVKVTKGVFDDIMGINKSDVESASRFLMYTTYDSIKMIVIFK